MYDWRTTGCWVSSMLSKGSARVVVSQLLCSTSSWRRYYSRLRVGRRGGLPSRLRIFRRRGSSSWSTYHFYLDRDARHVCGYSTRSCTCNVRRAGTAPLLHSCSPFLLNDVCRDINNCAFWFHFKEKRGNVDYYSRLHRRRLLVPTVGLLCFLCVARRSHLTHSHP